jgi:DNA adenine methylase
MIEASSGQEEIPPRALSPILRWAGGKRWLAKSVRKAAVHCCPTSYIEPFLGGAAVFLAAEWPSPVLGDVNSAVMHCYRGLAEDPATVRRKLRQLKVDLDTYRRVSRWKPRSATGAAARLMYLNRTAFAGIYRENRNGNYNVPFAGDRDLVTVLKDDRIERVGSALRRADLRVVDFAGLVCEAGAGALIYCDPPYALDGAEREFRRYSGSPFAWADQIRLATLLRAATARGACVMMSNSAAEEVRSLYLDAQVLPLVRRTRIGAGPSTERKEALYVLHGDSSVAESMAHTLSVSLGES